MERDDGARRVDGESVPPEAGRGQAGHVDGGDRAAGRGETGHAESELPEVERRIADFIERELLGSGMTVGADDDLLSGELVDSVGMLRLVSFLEEAFGIGVRPEDYLIENFRSVAALAGYVRRAGGGAGRPPAAPSE